VTSTTRDINDSVPVITKTITGHVDNSSYPLIAVDIQLTLTTPAQATGPEPVIMEFGLSPEVLAAMAKRLHPGRVAAADAGQGLGIRDHHSDEHSGR
jgi:hypothetical protein